MDRPKPSVPLYHEPCHWARAAPGTARWANTARANAVAKWEMCRTMTETPRIGGERLPGKRQSVEDGREATRLSPWARRRCRRPSRPVRETGGQADELGAGAGASAGGPDWCLQA